MEVNSKLPMASLLHAVNSTGAFARTVPWGYSINNQDWEIKPDSTCGDMGKKEIDGGGFEAISPPHSGFSHLNEIEKVAEALARSGAQVNNHCGVHCHVEIKDFDTVCAATLAAYWCKIEKIISNMTPRHRTAHATSKYCRLLTTKHTIEKKKYDPGSFWQLIKPKNLGPTGKRTAISFVNYLRSKSSSSQWENFVGRCTVELRLPEGSVNSLDVKNWVRMFVHFVESCRSRPFPDDISFVSSLKEALHVLGLQSNADEEFWLLSPGLFDTKVWVLNRILRFSESESLKAESRELLSSLAI